jgi:hypothetical protein
LAIIIFSIHTVMLYNTLYLQWDFNRTPWKGYTVISSVPDVDGSVKVHLESHVEQHYIVAQLHADYLVMYVNYEGEAVLPPPCVMTATGGGVITVKFSFTSTE